MISTGMIANNDVNNFSKSEEWTSLLIYINDVFVDYLHTYRANIPDEQLVLQASPRLSQAITFVTARVTRSNMSKRSSFGIDGSSLYRRRVSLQRKKADKDTNRTKESAGFIIRCTEYNLKQQSGIHIN